MESRHFHSVSQTSPSYSLLLPSLALLDLKCWLASELSFGLHFSWICTLSLGDFTHSHGFKFHLYAGDSRCICSPDLSSEFYLAIGHQWSILYGCTGKFWLPHPILFHFSKWTLIHPVAQDNLGNHFKSFPVPIQPLAWLLNSTWIPVSNAFTSLCLHFQCWFTVISKLITAWVSWLVLGLRCCLVYTVLLAEGRLLY